MTKISGKDFLYRLPSTFSPPLELSPLGAGPAICTARIPTGDAPNPLPCQRRQNNHLRFGTE